MARVAAKHGGFYISHIRDEADKSMEAHPRSDRDRREGEAAGADHAHQAGHGRRVGQGRRSDRDDRCSPEARRRRDGGRVSLPGVVIQPEGPGPRQAVDRPVQREGSARRRRRRQERADHAAAEVIRSSSASVSTRSPGRKASAKSTCTSGSCKTTMRA